MKAFVTPLRRAVTARSALATTAAMRTATRATHTTESRLFARSFSSEIRRPKAVKVKKGEARRRVESKPAETDALVEQQQHAEVPAEYNQGGPFMPQQGPTTFGGMMKESFFWGIGMAIAFTFVGVIFGAMEETETPGAYEGSYMVTEEPTEEQVDA